MTAFPMKSLLMAGACLAALGAATQGAQAQSRGSSSKPDLVINAIDSRILVTRPSCNTADPLVSGFIAIKNVGNDSATFGTSGTTSDAARAVLNPNAVSANRSPAIHVYNPYNLDMAPEFEGGANADRLSPLDQRGFKFKFAEGQRKDQRNYYPPDLSSSAGDNLTLRDRNRLIQHALNEALNIAIAVDGQYGPETRGAASQYQRLINAPATGQLTEEQIDRLFQETYTSFGASGKVCVDIFAMADPFNVVDESNEANNLVGWRVEIDCSPLAAKARIAATPSSDPYYKPCRQPGQ